jgi:hypothetical protein
MSTVGHACYTYSLHSQQALDSELRSGEVVDQSVDFDVISNLLNSLEAESDTSGPGPVSNILREMGLCPPRVDPNGNE